MLSVQSFGLSTPQSFHNLPMISLLLQQEILTFLAETQPTEKVSPRNRTVKNSNIENGLSDNMK